MNEREIFIAASQIDDARLRAAFLETVCEGDASLRKRIDSLLDAGAAENIVDRPARLIEQLAGELAAGDPSEFEIDESNPEWAKSKSSESDSRDTIQPGTKIGPYEIRELLGQGGMGVVHVAKQLEPVKRLVALKLLRPGDTSRNVLARFEQERHALAMMDHPGIAKILDAGTTADGRPWFVMELVKGIPINEYCDRENLSPRERLQLFIPVCAAVQHAHQKGIIHRDLKPSNILIARYDGEPVPKVIDFGVAKAIGFRLAEESIDTEVGSIVGTIEYMAPEQAELNNLDIDTRADVYALGVVLYELLTGSPPFSRIELQSAAFHEMLRMIREVEPPKPSTKISASHEVASIAAHRQLEPRQLTKLLSGDLDWVVMKALAKERKRRYQSVSDLAADVHRFLNLEAVAAGPPRVSYRFWKFVQRNRASAVATGLVLLVVVAGTVATTWGWLESRRQYKGARTAEAAEREAREVAELRLKQVENGIQVLTSVFNDLNPEVDEASNADLRNVLALRLDQAAEQLEANEVGNTLSVARMQFRLAVAQRELGFPERALAGVQRAEATFLQQGGQDDPELLKCRELQALCLKSIGDFAKSLDMMNVNLEAKRRVLGVAHEDTLATMNNIAGVLGELGRKTESIECYEQVVQLIRDSWPADDPIRMTAEHNLAAAKFKSGDILEAIPELQDVLARRTRVLGNEDSDTLNSMMAVAAALRVAGRFREALPLIEEALRIHQKILGPDHPQTLRAISNLAMTLQDLGQTDKAIPLLEQALRQKRLKLGNNHPDTLMSMANLAVAWKDLGKLEQALPLYEESLERRRKILGPEHPDTLTSINNLGTFYLVAKQFERALPLLQECLAQRKKVHGSDHPAVAVSINNLAKAFQGLGQLDTAVELFEAAIEIKTKGLGTDHPSTLIGMCSLAQALAEQKKYDQAIPLLEKTIDLAIQRHDGLPAELTRLPELLATFYRDAGRMEEAELQYRKVLDDHRQRLGNEHARSLQLQYDLARLMLDRNKLADAENECRNCLDSRIENEPDLWTTFQTRCLLGAILTSQQQFEESERLLSEGYNGMRARSTTIPNRLREAVLAEASSWLAQVYRLTGRTENADELETPSSENN